MTPFLEDMRSRIDGITPADATGAVRVDQLVANQNAIISILKDMFWDHYSDPVEVDPTELSVEDTVESSPFAP